MQPSERPARRGSPELTIVLAFALLLWLLQFLIIDIWHFTGRQAAEFFADFVLFSIALAWVIWQIVTARERRENEWPHPYLAVSRRKDERAVRKAWSQNAVVLGYDVHGEPWLWPDRTRVMQGIVLGMTGMGKTTLLANIITQDLLRVFGPPEDQHRVPMIILDGKADAKAFESLLPHIHRAGRLGQLRVINPSRPDFSVGYNPFHSNEADYMSVVNMVFSSFDLHHEFFAKHQLTYLSDIVRVLSYTGLKFNFYDVLVMAFDQQVLREQVEKASRRLEQDQNISVQRKLNFEMSVRNLLQSFQDWERVPRIQGLLNECMAFLDDELSVVTGSYEDLLSLDEVIEEELILYVLLNVNKKTKPVTALGKMLLQNLQLIVGQRYESQEKLDQPNRPLVSVVLDEFAPFGYRNFPQILQTARGTNTAFLFSMQSLSQLMQVGRGFKEDVASAPNTTMVLQTHSEETARYFLQASAEHRVRRRNVSMERRNFLGYERYEESGRAVDVETTETRALDEHIKNMPKGQMQILMTDEARGTLHGHLHIRPPADVRVPHFKVELYPKLQQSRQSSVGANLRFKSPRYQDTRYRRRSFGEGRL
ncbi:MAG TPA: type IV secretory system conjugative DNA transfer family protein [Candidatus Sulfotelmatobacter sp.]|nr:type IV secretory system conjugative DNA transfer family protein [Candidatus Sulfotelmatobacter sp.]HEV3481925.1 type IV secretory system conjugative DNA transfer family protein [Candidatus Acidoferrales bacterium]